MSRVLLAEDETDIAMMYRTLFEKNGFEVTVAGDGIQCVELAGRDQPDIILLDIMMPNLDGLGALEQLKADSKTSNIPVIMLTNQGDNENAQKAIQIGADSYIIKSDEDPHDTVKMVQSMLKLGDSQRAEGN